MDLLNQDLVELVELLRAVLGITSIQGVVAIAPLMGLVRGGVEDQAQELLQMEITALQAQELRLLRVGRRAAMEQAALVMVQMRLRLVGAVEVQKHPLPLSETEVQVATVRSG